MQILIMFLVFIAGMLAPSQAGINSTLSRYLGSNFLAALVSFSVGTLALAAYALIFRLQMPLFRALSQGPWWMWLGGLCGAFLVTTTILAAPRLGATTMIGFLLAGQMIASLLLDHFGVLGYPGHAINLWRILGVVLLASGVMLIRAF
jgi:transporter family-2 protein